MIYFSFWNSQLRVFGCRSPLSRTLHSAVGEAARGRQSSRKADTERTDFNLYLIAPVSFLNSGQIVCFMRTLKYQQGPGGWDVSADMYKPIFSPEVPGCGVLALVKGKARIAIIPVSVVYLQVRLGDLSISHQPRGKSRAHNYGA